MVWYRKMSMRRRLVTQNDVTAGLVADLITNVLERANSVFARDDRKATQG